MEIMNLRGACQHTHLLGARNLRCPLTQRGMDEGRSMIRPDGEALVPAHSWWSRRPCRILCRFATAPGDGPRLFVKPAWARSGAVLSHLSRTVIGRLLSRRALGVLVTIAHRSIAPLQLTDCETNTFRNGSHSIRLGSTQVMQVVSAGLTCRRTALKANQQQYLCRTTTQLAGTGLAAVSCRAIARHRRYVLGAPNRSNADRGMSPRTHNGKRCSKRHIRPRPRWTRSRPIGAGEAA
jgi:hypothetical protein